MAQKRYFPSRRKYAPESGYFPSDTVGNKWLQNAIFRLDGNKHPKNAIFRLAQMVPPIEYDLGYRFRRQTLNPNPNPNPDPNP